MDTATQWGGFEMFGFIQAKRPLAYAAASDLAFIFLVQRSALKPVYH